MKNRNEAHPGPGEHSGKTPIQRHLEKAGLLRPRITMPEPPPQTNEYPTSDIDDVDLTGHEEGSESSEEGDLTDPKGIPSSSAAQIKIPR